MFSSPQLELALESLCCPLPWASRGMRARRADGEESKPRRTWVQLALHLSRPRTPVAVLVATSAPPRPACFTTDADWKDWLLSAHASGVRIVRRSDTGESRGDRHAPYVMLPTKKIDYCAECPWSKRREMSRLNRCDPCEAALAMEADECAA